MAYLFVPFPVTLDDLEGHSHNAGLIKCNSTNIFATLSHRPTVTLQLHNFDLFRTYRTSSFCTVVWQLARFQLTQRIALSLGDSWASCLNRLPWSPYSPKYPMFCGWGHNWHQRSCCAQHISSQSQWATACQWHTVLTLVCSSNIVSMNFTVIESLSTFWHSDIVRHTCWASCSLLRCHQTRTDATV